MTLFPSVSLKRILFLYATFSLFIIKAVAQQQDLPAFGKVSMEELQMKECSFEKDADAMILINEGSYSFKMSTYDFRVIYEQRVRIKVFNNRGFSYTNVFIPNAKTNASKITDLDAYVYNTTPDGKITVKKVDKDQIFKEKDAKRKTSNIRFTFPDLQPGSVVEYRFTQIKKNSISPEPWFFQNLIPVQASVYKLDIPKGMNLKTKLVTTQLAEEDSSVVTEGSKRETRFKQFVMHRIPSFKIEPFMSSVNDNLERVEFFLYPTYFFMFSGTPDATWKIIGNMLKGYDWFGGQIERPIAGTEQAIDSIKKMPSDSEKINAVYELVKQNVSWDGAQLYYPEDIQDAWNSKNGSSAEINILLLNLLKKAGIKCGALLVSTKENGKPDMNFPTLSQFNGIDVLIQDSIHDYILDATQKYQPYTIPPVNVINTEGLLISNQSEWVTISDYRPLMNSSVYIKASLNHDGVLYGIADVVYSDYAKIEELKEKEKDDKEKKEEEKDFLKYDNIDVVIDSVKTTDSVAVTEPLRMKIHFHYTLNNNDDYYFLNPYFFSMFRKNPFSSSERHSDIDFGCAQKSLTYIVIDIPDNFTVEDVSKSTRMLTSDTSLSFKKEAYHEKGQIALRYVFEINNPLFPKESYSGIKDFFDKTYGIIGQQVLLKKKND